MTSSAEIRIVTSEDARSALEYFAKLQAENLSTIFRVHPLPTLEEEVAFLRSFEVNPNSNWFAAVSDGAIVGSLGIQADTRPQRSRVGDLGMSILSTSQGVCCDRDARAAGVGGEVLCEVWERGPELANSPCRCPMASP